MAIWDSLSHDSKTLRLLKLAALSAKLVSSASFKEFIKVHGSHWLSYPSFFIIFWNPIKMFIYFHPQPICGPEIECCLDAECCIVHHCHSFAVFKYKNDDDFLLVTYTIIQNIPIQVHKHLEQWAANADAPGEQSGVRCLAQGSHLSRGIEGGENARYWLPPPTIPAGAEIRTRNLSYKSYALSIRPRLPPNAIKACELTCFYTWVLQNALIYVSETL